MDLHWRNTQKPARFFMLDARSFTTMFLFMVHMKLWTFILVSVTMLSFWVFERRGLTFEAALRAIRVWFLGKKRPALRRKFRRDWVDFG